MASNYFQNVKTGSCNGLAGKGRIGGLAKYISLNHQEITEKSQLDK